jgi:hypothetical protein
MIWDAALVTAGAAIGVLLTWMVLVVSPRLKADYSTLRHHAKVHSFRVCTAIAAWILLIAAFIYYPRFISETLRGFSHGVEQVTDPLPDKVGAYAEIALRELGGLLWLQIAALILALRVAMGSLAALWRLLRR